MTQVRDDVGHDRYEVLQDGTLAGFAQYRKRGSLIAFIHTEIDPEHGGKGLGSALIAGALDDARAHGLDVLPFCPFVKAFIEKHPQYLDLVPASRRGDFDL